MRQQSADEEGLRLYNPQRTCRDAADDADPQTSSDEDIVGNKVLGESFTAHASCKPPSGLFASSSWPVMSSNPTCVMMSVNEMP